MQNDPSFKTKVFPISFLIWYIVTEILVITETERLP